ncbi:MAG TPA: VOC family protein [Candidatus Dormibacteraeota bacterium]|nr:VOC family protein [Candidatus Dormibacteraeota bacterium]
MLSSGLSSGLTSAKMMGFVLTKDYDKARAFFEGKLGFAFVSLDQFALVMKAGENMIRISKVPNSTALQSTVLGWEVQDVEAVVKWLKGRGVDCEKYPFVQDKELGIWSTPNGDKVAWFKDPDGNVLSVSQHSGIPAR